MGTHREITASSEPISSSAAQSIKKAALIAGTVGLIALGAHIKFFLPGNPVPVTLQTLFVLIAGATLGVEAGAAAVALYILCGMAGLPFFAGAGPTGLVYLTGPTGGYLVGFVASVVIVGKTFSVSSSALLRGLSLATGAAVILACGCLHLTWYTGFDFQKAIALGVLPFLPGTAVKVATAWAVLTAEQSIRKRLKQ